MSQEDCFNSSDNFCDDTLIEHLNCWGTKRPIESRLSATALIHRNKRIRYRQLQVMFGVAMIVATASVLANYLRSSTAPDISKNMAKQSPELSPISNEQSSEWEIKNAGSYSFASMYSLERERLSLQQELHSLQRTSIELQRIAIRNDLVLEHAFKEVLAH